MEKWKSDSLRADPLVRQILDGKRDQGRSQGQGHKNQVHVERLPLRSADSRGRYYTTAAGKTSETATFNSFTRF